MLPTIVTIVFIDQTISYISIVFVISDIYDSYAVDDI